MRIREDLHKDVFLCISVFKVPGRWYEEQLFPFFMWVTMAGSNEGIFQGRVGVMDPWHH